MVKVITLYRTPADVEAFERWLVQHLARIERIPYLRRLEVSRIWGTPIGVSPFHLMVEMYFDDRAVMEAALRSPEAVEASADLSRFMAGQVLVMFADVFEEERLRK
ncbi:EthD family reductase [Thermoflexus sp.]|uniref:EthD family reductase n=1 Tax=Thermoflexus sp. TaxID=1969742 RepID=UPI0035E44280